MAHVKNPGIDVLCEAIVRGESYRTICAEYGVSIGTVYNWLNETQATTEQSARARSLSAEAWLDKGMDVLQSSLSKSGDVDPSAARAIAQECARRAAIRNPQYRDKTETALTGADGAAITFALIERVIVDPVIG